MKLALIRIGIFLEWSLFFYALFFVLDVVLPEFISSSIALLITVAAFLNKRNERQHAILKRPVIEILK